ncbi:MAG: hypothetical protein KME29_28155 [Calothrix sp. FI2-JRJ7]|jgi:hypothetical protein|nr:hypothetical protein [Calothrix sp. FI2-JRJ7]
MTEFKVMTWNVENLFRFGSKFGAKTQEDYTQKLKSFLTCEKSGKRPESSKNSYEPIFLISA